MTTSQVMAQKKFVANYDETKIPKYTLPNPLVTESGEPVSNAEMWNEIRRPELLKLFQQQVYGHSPDACVITHELVSSKEMENVTRREVDV